LSGPAIFSFLLAIWGPQAGSLDLVGGDDEIDVADLSFLLGAWGACD
jgi:hypothetical protein